MNLRSLANTALLLTLCATAWTTVPAKAAMTDEMLREQGRALFHGERAFDGRASVAGVMLPADAVACARCHGSTGAGGREGGVAVPALPSFADRPVTALVDAERLLGTLASGRGRDGHALRAPMPSYAFSAGERQALAAFLAVLGSDAEPVRGVEPGVVRLGTFLPASGPRAAIGRAVLSGMQAHFEEIGRAGGVYGRRIELVPMALPSGSTEAGLDDLSLQGLLRHAAGQAPVLALVGSFVGELTPAAARLLPTLRLPMIGNLGPALADGAGTTPPGWLSTMLPSVQAQLRGTVAEFDAGCAAGEGLTVAAAPLPGLQDAVMAALPGRPLKFEPALTAGTEAPSRRRLLVLHGTDGVEAVRRELLATDCLWTLAMFSGAASPGAMRELVVLPGQAALPLNGADPEALWRSLGRLSAQLATEALARAGRQLQPEQVALALGTLVDFEPALGVRLELSRLRRHALPVLTTWRKPDDNPR